VIDATDPATAANGATARNMEWTAWGVLLSALAVFGLLLVGLPYLLAQFARQATVPEEAQVESKVGSVMLESSAGITQVLGTGQRRDDVSEGITVTTQPNAEAFVRLFDDSVVHLRPGTSLGLARMRRPRFAAGGQHRDIRLFARPAEGGPGVLTVGATGGDVQLTVGTPHGLVQLGPDAQARLQFTPEGVSVVGGDGRVTVSSAGRAAELGFDQRSTLRAGRPPTAPTSAEVNVVANADFEEPLQPDGAWRLQYDPATIASDAQAVSLPDGGQAVRFSRSETNGRPGDIYYRQQLSVDVAEARHLGVTADLRILSQELSGGGVGASEFPVILSLIYADETGEELRWETGFYAKPLGEGDTGSTPLDPARTVLAQDGEWLRFQSGNLLDPARVNPRGFEALRLPRPMRLLRIEVKASGHDLESEVDRVGVWVK
jgi:hypothetical protein